MIKYTIGYKENGQQKNVRAEIKEDSEIMGFIANLPADNNALLKKVEEFNLDDMDYPLLGEENENL